MNVREREWVMESARENLRVRKRMCVCEREREKECELVFETEKENAAWERGRKCE